MKLKFEMIFFPRALKFNFHKWIFNRFRLSAQWHTKLEVITKKLESIKIKNYKLEPENKNIKEKKI